MAGPEKQFEDKLKKFLTDKDYWFVKTWGRGGMKKGVPDILSVINGYFVSWEVKRSDHQGVLAPVQKRNASQIGRNGGVAVIASDMSTVYAVEKYLLHNAIVTKKDFTEDELSVLHLTDEPASEYDTSLYEGIWVPSEKL